MRIAQVILSGASAYECKSQRIDLALLSTAHDVIVCDLEAAASSGATLVHVYGSDLPASGSRRLPMPYIASGFRRPRLALRRPPQPRYVVSPFATEQPEVPVEILPEAVEDHYFAEHRQAGPTASPRFVGTFGRHRLGVTNAAQQALARIERFRGDVTWQYFEQPPSPADLAGVDVWVDPTSADTDFDGFVAEAVAAGKPVVASRTPINAHRLENGRSGFLVPPGDSNELVHAILAALFKPEVAQQKIDAARQTAGKFRPRQRLRALDRIYRNLMTE